jgi:hypothetical protein
MMMWLAIAGGLYFGRNHIARVLGPYLESLDPERTVYNGHVMTLVSCFLFTLPIEFAGLGQVKILAYKMCLWSCVMTAVLKIKFNNGAPPMPSGPMSLSNIRESATQAAQTVAPWLQKVMMGGVDFHFLFLAVIFLNAYPALPVALILGRRSLWTVCTYCQKNSPDQFLFKRFAPTWTKLNAKTEEVMIYASLAEILLGVWLAVSMFLPSRQIVTTILYWHFLKTRYQVPRSQKYQIQAWRSLDQQVAPVFNKVPILRKPVDLVKGWFTAMPQ